MKGPYERTKYDFRRVWECPVCRQKVRTEGHVTSQFCACQQKPEAPTLLVPMHLISDRPQRLA